VNDQDQQKIEQITQLLIDEFGETLLAVYFFGSWLTEYKTKESDIDIAIICKQRTDSVTLWNVAQEIAIKHHRPVDLLDLNNTTTVMKIQVISKGERVYCVDHDYCEQFENIAYSAYTLLNEERKAILQDIAARGNIYG